MGAATQLEQAFLNLILNAAEAMPGGGALTITSRSVRLPRGSAQPTHVAVEFRDTGQGMSEEQRRRAFTSVLSTTKAKGTGLGLAIVARVVEAHRGEDQDQVPPRPRDDRERHPAAVALTARRRLAARPYSSGG